MEGVTMFSEIPGGGRRQWVMATKKEGKMWWDQ